MRRVRRCPACRRETAPEKKFCPFDGTALEDAFVPEEPPPSTPGLGPRLVVDAGNGTIQEVPIVAPTLTIGTARENKLVLPDPTVSRSHAVVRVTGEEYRVADVQSRNGVLVNGERVPPDGRLLRNGDVIVLGRTSLRFVHENERQERHTTNKDQPLRDIPAPLAAEYAPTSRQGFGFIDVLEPDEPLIRVEVELRRLTIGRAPENDIVLKTPTISRRHAILDFTGAAWRITNVGRNVVTVNGSPVGPDPMPVRYADVVTVGAVTLTLYLYTTEVHASWQSKDGSSAALHQVRQMPHPGSALFRVQESGELIASTPPSVSAVPSPPPASPTTGRFSLDGKYEIEEKIAAVSTGTIYRARRVALGDDVAVRILRPDLVADAAAVERFRRQAQVAARIRHPNAVQVFDFGVSSEGAVFIVEELLSGHTLRTVVREQKGLTLPRIVGLFNQICGAVHAANLNGIVLRDLKPSSIFIERAADGREIVKVGGFGLAKITDGSGGATVAAQAKVYGTPEYMSPEQWLERPLDSRSDVYTLGVILFELLTGRVPFAAFTPFKLAEMHLNTPAPSIQEFGRADLDDGVDTVVARALSKDPNKRQPTAIDLARELEAISGVGGGIVRGLITKATGRLPVYPLYVPVAPAPVPAGEVALPSVVAQPEVTGGGAFNRVVLALMIEAMLSRISGGLVKTSVPLFALLVFGFDITSVMFLVLIQNIVPLLLRPLFGTMADKYGKKRVFVFSLLVRTIVGALYALAVLPWVFYVISLVRGIADSAKGPSASAMIADSTDQRYIATAYSWYTTIKSTSGGIGEAVAAFMLVLLITLFSGLTSVTANVAILDELNKRGAPKEVFLGSPDEVAADGTIAGDEAHPERRRVVRVEQRTVRLKAVPIESLPKVVATTPLRNALVAIFIAATVLSFLSLMLVAIVLKEKKKDKKDKKSGASGAMAEPAADLGPRPNVWAFAILGTALTAPAYMVTGEFFTILAVKLEVTPDSLGWIKILAETLVPLVFGPVFGWIADRIGPGKVIAMRSAANMVTSLLFWITPWFAGTALLGTMMGTARAVDEIGKAAFKPTWGAIAARVSSFDLGNRSRTMGILEGGVDASDLTFPVIAGVLLQYLSLGWLMAVRAVLAVIAEIYSFVLTRKYKI